MRAKTLRLLILAATALALAACETVGVKEEEGRDVGVEERGAAPELTPQEQAEAARIRRLEEAGAFRGDPVEDPDSPLSQRLIYFELDSSEIDDQYKPIVEAHAAYLGEHNGALVTLEGHADERGSREYNLGLGERRAMAVRRLLSLLGAGDEQIQVVSYGEEQPAVEGHDESAWRKNRRVEILYRAR